MGSAPKKAPKKKPETEQDQVPKGELVVMGAPTKFRPEYVDALLEFFDVEPYRKEKMEESVELDKNGKPKKMLVKHKLVPNKLPTLFQFARSIKVSYSTVWRWANQGQDPELIKRVEGHMEGKEILHPDEFVKIKALRDFCEAYNDAKEMQKEFLINMGLAGVAPPASFIFVAKNVTDMQDEKKHTLTGADGGPIDLRLNELSDAELQRLAQDGEAGAGT